MYDNCSSQIIDKMTDFQKNKRRCDDNESEHIELDYAADAENENDHNSVSDILFDYKDNSKRIVPIAQQKDGSETERNGGLSGTGEL